MQKGTDRSGMTLVYRSPEVGVTVVPQKNTLMVVGYYGFGNGIRGLHIVALLNIQT